MAEHSSLVKVHLSQAREWALSSDGKYLVSGGAGVQVWRVKSGKRVASMEAGDVQALAVSKDGRWIATGTSDGKLCVWNANTRKQLWSLWIGFVTINAIDFSPDSTRLVTTSSSFNLTITESLTHAVTVWNVATGKRLLSPLPHGYKVRAAKFSPQGDRIAAVTQNSIRVYNSNNGHLLLDIPVTVTPRGNNDFFWSNNHLFIQSGGEINQVEVFLGSAVSEWTIPDTNADSCIAFPRHGAYMVCSAKRTITFWDTSTHIRLGVIHHAQSVYSIAFSPDDCFLAVGGVNGEVTIHSVSEFAITVITQDLIKSPCLCTLLQPAIEDGSAFYSWRHDQLANMQASLTALLLKSREACCHALAIRALVRIHLQQWDAAIDDAKQSIEIEPSVIGHIAKSVALVGKGEKLEGYRAYDIVFQHFQSTHVNLLLLIKAVIVFMAGDHDDAISRLDDLIATVPLNSTYCVVQAYMYLLLGNSHMGCNNHEHAIQLFKHALTQLSHDSSWHLLVISLISGWKFESIGITIRQYLCEALYVTGCVDEGGKYLVEIVNTFDKSACAVSKPIIKWVSDFTHRCLSTSKSENDATFEASQESEAIMDHEILDVSTSMQLLREWVKSTLACFSWKDALASTTKFRVSRFTVYQVICKHLDTKGSIADAIECLHCMICELDGKPDPHGKQARWILDFKQCCAEKLVFFGDAAVMAEHHDPAVIVEHHDDAIAQYSAALLLDPATPQDILIKRSKVYMMKKLWKKALDDTNKVIALDPLSQWNYDDVLVEWANVELVDRSWRDILTTAGCFEVPKFTIYRVICEHLEMTNHVMDAIKCLQQMKDELYEKTIVPNEQKWILDFQQCCAKRLEYFGDMAAGVGQHVKAINQFSTALSLNPAVPQDILIKRSHVYMAKRMWIYALDDTNQVLTLDPSSPWGYDRVLMKWAKVELTYYASWSDVLATAGCFKISRFMVYQALCEHLEAVDRVADATECFHQMTYELAYWETKCEQEKWSSDFKSRCCQRSEYLGDVSTIIQRYDEAISLYSAALSLNPVDPQAILGRRSKAYEASGLWNEALDDAEKIITLNPSSPFGYERKYVALRGARRHAEAFSTFDITLLKMSQSLDPEICERSRKYIKAKEIICGAVQNAIRELPQVLIDTASGRLCNKHEQAATFESFPTFLELILSTTTKVDHARIEKEVAEYYRYAMFSHKWEENEPLFEKVIHSAVYGLEESPTHNKLQTFCKISRDAGFHWAWSDTCCINKADHHVLQEALILMFKWYEGSSLTIVLLRGVRSPSRHGDLMSSIWNQRAWTLQEYHASKVVRFYVEDWTPYLNLDIANHKESPEIISEMEEATGVSAHALMTLRPGPDDIRDKLRLASTRHTTRVEDAAYSLFGIFSTSFPVVYGEGDKALGRLLAQLLTSSGDVSVLAWTGRSGTFNSCLPIDISVFGEPPTTHIPQAIPNTEPDAIAAKLSASPLNSTLMELYDKLDQIPVPFFVGQRMKLPCIAFKLGPVSTREGSEDMMFRAQVIALGTVEITTREDLSRLDSLHLVHPWIDFLLDRQPIGSAAEMMAEETTIEPSAIGGLASFPGAFNVSTVSETQTGWFTRLGISFGGWPTATPGDVVSLRPPSSLTPAEKKMQALRMIARLRQPFGALLLARNRGHVAAYRRVATESLITVQVEEITPALLSRLVNSVRVLDVL